MRTKDDVIKQILNKTLTKDQKSYNKFLRDYFLLVGQRFVDATNSIDCWRHLALVQHKKQHAFYWQGNQVPHHIIRRLMFRETDWTMDAWIRKPVPLIQRVKRYFARLWVKLNY